MSNSSDASQASGHASFPAALASMNVDPRKVGVIVVDHGSRREESNQLLLEVAERFREETGCRIVEPAHMELAEPSIQTAFARAVARGAELVVVHPYFLSPGRHWHQDIPDLTAKAAALHSGVRYLVTAPLGLHHLIPQIIQDRVEQCLMRNLMDAEACELCRESQACQIHSSGG